MWFPFWLWTFHWSEWRYCWSELSSPPPPFRASWLVLSRLWPWNQVDTYVYSLLLVRTWKNKGGQLRKALSFVIYLAKIFIALSLVFVPSYLIVRPPPPPPPHGGALSASTCILFLRVWSKLEKGALIISLYWPQFDTPFDAWGCRLTFLTWSTKESVIVNVFSQTLYLSDVAQWVFPPLTLAGIALRFLASAPQPYPFNASLPPSLPVAYYLECVIDFLLILFCFVV